MNTITVKIQENREENLSVGEVAKQLLEKRTYKNKDGEEITVTELVFDLIPLKPESQKTIYQHEKFDLVKTHIAVKRQTKEEREAKTNKFYVGNGRTVWTDGKIQAFEYKKDSGQERKAESDKQADETDLPF